MAFRIESGLQNTSNRINNQLKYFKIHLNGLIINSNTLKYIKTYFISLYILIYIPIYTVIRNEHVIEMQQRRDMISFIR